MQGADTPVARGRGGGSERAECGSGDLETRGVSEVPTDRGKSSVPVRGTVERCEGPFTSAPTWPQTGFILGAWTSQGVAVHLQELVANGWSSPVCGYQFFPKGLPWIRRRLGVSGLNQVELIPGA